MEEVVEMVVENFMMVVVHGGAGGGPDGNFCEKK